MLHREVFSKTFTEQFLELIFCCTKKTKNNVIHSRLNRRSCCAHQTALPSCIFSLFSFWGWRAFSAVVCVFYHIQKGADWYLRQTESEINNKKIGGKNMFFRERNVSLPQSNVKEMACFRTPMTLKCQRDIVMTGMPPPPPS